MQVDEEAMYSSGTIYMQVDEEAIFYAEQSTCKWMDDSMRKPCILCGTIYMQVDEEAMYSMRNNLHASG